MSYYWAKYNDDPNDEPFIVEHDCFDYYKCGCDVQISCDDLTILGGVAPFKVVK